MVGMALFPSVCRPVRRKGISRQGPRARVNKTAHTKKGDDIIVCSNTARLPYASGGCAPSRSAKNEQSETSTVRFGSLDSRFSSREFNREGSFLSEGAVKGLHTE